MQVSRLDGDRFVPIREGVNRLELAERASRRPNATSVQLRSYESALGVQDAARVLRFSSRRASAPRQSGEVCSSQGDQYERQMRGLAQRHERADRRAPRVIPTSPERTLDAPNLLDDYYLNLLSWSRRNQLAVALGQSVYLWDPVTSSIEQLMEVRSEDHYVASISFSADGAHLAVGTSDAETHIYDAARLRHLRTMRGHAQRVGSLAWNGHTLTSGGRDARIVHHDTRMADDRVAVLEHHQQEVCGLQWSPDGTQLASGGNDNLCCVWDAGKHAAPRRAFAAHRAAVKALAWSPHHSGLLASGGGTADRCVRFWDTRLGTCLSVIDTRSQVCALQWSSVRDELVSSHGFDRNQLVVWRYPTMSRVAELTGHTARVLHLAQSPDGSTFVSASADETLRFWAINAPARSRGERTPRGLESLTELSEAAAGHHARIL